MAELDPRTPVLVGAGQITHRPGDGDAPSPLELMAEAARRAEADSGAPGLLVRAGTVAVVEPMSWPVPDPAALLAAEVGAAPRHTVITARGGNSPLALLADLAAAVAEGDLDVALLAGGEAFGPFMRAMREGASTGWPEQPEGTEPSRVVGTDAEPSHAAETAAGLIAPILYYPLFEHALRGVAGRTVAEHERWVASWWSRFTRVAAGNEHAWSREERSAQQVGTPGPGNRLVSSPYPKAMNANIVVDQGAALVLCSAEAAAAAGIARDRWVFVHAIAQAQDRWFVGERARLDRSPAIAACARAALGHAGVGLDDVAHVDLYSCFPSAVQVAAGELGLDLDDPDRTPTVTGGLAFFGGPASNYVTHVLATLVERLRGHDGDTAMCTAIGWYLTKHGTAILGASPPAAGFRALGVQDEVDAGERVHVDEGFSGAAPVETYTAIYDRDGTATMGVVVARTPDGGRAFAASHDHGVVAELLADEPLGRSARFDGAVFTL